MEEHTDNETEEGRKIVASVDSLGVTYCAEGVDLCRRIRNTIKRIWGGGDHENIEPITGQVLQG